MLTEEQTEYFNKGYREGQQSVYIEQDRQQLRQQYAGLAMQGILCSPYTKEAPMELIAELAVKQADPLILKVL